MDVFRANSSFRTDAIALVTHKCAVAYWQKIFSYDLENLTSGWESPSLSARMVYPKLCQSMRSFVWRKKQTRDAIASVGIEGGFCDGQRMDLALLRWYHALGTRRGITNLDEKPFGWFCTICQDPEQADDLKKNFQRTGQ